MRREPRQSKGSRPDNGPVKEIQEGLEDVEIYYEKPELEAEPVIDPTIRGPIKSRFELRSHGTIKAEAIKDLRTLDTVEARNTDQPRSNEPRSNMPLELHTNTMSEARVGTLTEQQMKQQIKVSKTSISTSTVVPSDSSQLPTNQSPLEPFQTISTESSELAEESDVIVQELGLVNLRKKALSTQATAIGKRPEDVEGRKREEFKELLEREARLKGRLDEIESERQGQEGVT
jgi:hypothetical protein